MRPRSALSTHKATLLSLSLVLVSSYLAGCAHHNRSSNSHYYNQQSSSLTAADQAYLSQRYAEAARLYQFAAQGQPERVAAQLRLRAATSLMQSNDLTGMGIQLAQIKPYLLSLNEKVLFQKMLTMNNMPASVAPTPKAISSTASAQAGSVTYQVETVPVAAFTVDTENADLGARVLESKAHASYGMPGYEMPSYELQGGVSNQPFDRGDGQSTQSNAVVLAYAPEYGSSTYPAQQSAHAPSHLSQRYPVGRSGRDVFAGPIDLESAGVLPPNRRHSATTSQHEATQASYPAYGVGQDTAGIDSYIRQPSSPYTSSYAQAHGGENLTLILPRSGRYAAAAASIEKGFREAMQQSGQQYAIEVLDSDGGTDINSLYQRAARNASNVVVGPLQRDRIEDLARYSFLDVPVLALNRVDELPTTDGKLYQFGLLPEDEAAATAREMIAQGHRRAAVFVPSGSRGDRIVAAFSQAFRQLGGTVPRVKRYSENSADLRGEVAALLGSKTKFPYWWDVRPGDPEQQPGEPMAGRRDADQRIDATFFFANTKNARIIRPLFLFHHAMDMPVYTTGAAVGTALARGDGDLDGVVFCGSPTIARNSVGNGLPLNETLRRATAQTELEALGADAFRVATQLGAMSQYGQNLSGATGQLSLDYGNRIQRDVPCRWIANAEIQAKGMMPERNRGQAAAASAAKTISLVSGY